MSNSDNELDAPSLFPHSLDIPTETDRNMITTEAFELAVAHAAELARKRQAFLDRNPIEVLLPGTRQQSIDRADMQRAMNAGELRGLPTAFGDL